MPQAQKPTNKFYSTLIQTFIMNTIKDINVETKEGKYLLMALAALTVSPEIKINGESRNGKEMTPDEMLKEIGKTVEYVYSPNHQS